MCYEKNEFNVLKTELKPCSADPLTDFTETDIAEPLIMTLGNI